MLVRLGAIALCPGCRLVVDFAVRTRGDLIFSPDRPPSVGDPLCAAAGAAGNVGIGFAIPVDTVRRVVNELIRYGAVVRPTLGINVADDQTTRGLFAQLRLPLEGVLVMSVAPRSPAAVARRLAPLLSAAVLRARAAHGAPHAPQPGAPPLRVRLGTRS